MDVWPILRDFFTSVFGLVVILSWLIAIGFAVSLARRFRRREWASWPLRDAPDRELVILPWLLFPCGIALLALPTLLHTPLTVLGAGLGAAMIGGIAPAILLVVKVWRDLHREMLRMPTS